MSTVDTAPSRTGTLTQASNHASAWSLPRDLVSKSSPSAAYSFISDYGMNLDKIMHPSAAPSLTHSDIVKLQCTALY